MRKTRANEADFVRITLAIIMPLGDFYNLKLEEKIQEALIEDLAPYSKEVLENAMRDIRQTHEKLPFNPIALIVKACKFYQPAAASTNFSHGKFLVDEKQQRQKQMVDEYCRGLINTTQGAQACAEGWFYDLEQYTREVANIQSGRILGVNTGYKSAVIYPDHKFKIPPQLREKEFWRDIHQQHRAGFIEVVVPQACIDAWRASVPLCAGTGITENSARGHLAHHLPSQPDPLDSEGAL